MPPVILLTTGNTPGELSSRYTVSETYGAAVAAAGGVPVSYAGGDPTALSKIADGLLLTGGGDVNPSRYGATLLPTDEVDELRDTTEWALLDAFLAAGKPVFGICRGVQVLNVYFGGTLLQDIPSHNYVCHAVHLSADSRLAALYGEKLHVNSYHHQVIGTVAPHFQAVAASPNGICEAIEHETLPIWGVQWHPERMILGSFFDTDCDQTALFSDFLQVCERNGVCTAP